MGKKLKVLLSEDSGQALVEYAFILGLVSDIAVIAIALLGSRVSGMFNTIQESFPQLGE